MTNSLNSFISERQYKVYFKCNKCSTEWRGLNKESQCLKCDGKGRNISFRPNSDTKLKCNICSKKFEDVLNKVFDPKQLICKTCYDRNEIRVFKCNKCFVEWAANKFESQCLECDGKGQSIPKKGFVNVAIEPKIQTSNIVAFRCNKCLVEWKANEKESQCLECDGKGNNIRLSTFNKKLAAFRCNKCSNEWEAIKTNSQCPKCDGRGYNIRQKRVEELRQFSCKKCHDTKKYSWFQVTFWSNQLEYSCDKCKTILSPLPKEEEFGTCRFLCPNCQNQFYGFGSKSPKLNLKSRCYECNDMIEPSEVIPKKGDIVPKTKKMHSCSKCEGSKNCPFKGNCLAFSKTN